MGAAKDQCVGVGVGVDVFGGLFSPHRCLCVGSGCKYAAEALYLFVALDFQVPERNSPQLLAQLDSVIALRLMAHPTPRGVSTVAVRGGCVTMTVAGEFTVVLSPLCVLVKTYLVPPPFRLAP